MICMMSEYNKSYLKTLLYPLLPAFIQALVKGLQTPDGFTSDFGLKKEILIGESWKVALVLISIYKLHYTILEKEKIMANWEFSLRLLKNYSKSK